MGKTTIEWTDASWNPIVGCSPVSPGCANCYAERLSATRLRNHPDYKGLSERPEGCYARWTGEVRFLADRLKEPLHWRAPRRIFVCDMGDLFHESVNDDWITRVFCVILSAHRHTYQILTKRPRRMQEWITKNMPYLWRAAGLSVPNATPLPNVWLGVSVENQHFADERIPLLLQTPAAVRWISAEPLLGPVDLDSEEEKGLHALGCGDRECRRHGAACDGINWVVCGGESGTNARPMHADWARSLRDQCQNSGVPFFFKQWGEYAPLDLSSEQTHIRVGKKRAGRVLDGREWNEFPQVAVAP